MQSLLLHWILNAAALWAAAAIVPGLEFNGGPGRLLLVAAVFGIVNSTLRPLLTILTCPLIVLTLGLFTLVINATDAAGHRLAVRELESGVHGERASGRRSGAGWWWDW